MIRFTADRFDRGPKIIHDLRELRDEIALPDHLAIDVEGRLTRYMNHGAAGDPGDVGVSDWGFQSSRIDEIDVMIHSFYVWAREFVTARVQ